MDQGRYPLDEGGGVVLHAGAHPFQRQADEGVLVKIRDELLVLGAHGHPGSLLLDDADHQIVGQAVEVVLDMLAADGMINFGDKDLVLLHGLQDLQKALLPGVVGLLPGQRTGRALDAGPLDQIVDVLEMVVERHAVHAAVFGQVGHGDFVQRLFGQQVL